MPVSRLVLSHEHEATLLALAEALLEGPGFPPAGETGLLARIDEELSFVETGIRDDFLLALEALEALPWFYGRFSRLTALPPDARRDFLESLDHTRFDTVRAIVNGVALLVRMFYYADRRVWPALGYEGPFAGLPPIESEQHRHYRARVQAASDP